MPLIYSASKKAVGENIKKEEKAGKSKKQSIAIALSEQRDAAKGSRKQTLEDAYARYVKENA